MGARDEQTQEAACVNHKPSLLGVKYRGRSIAGLTFPYRLQISMYKRKKILLLWNSNSSPGRVGVSMVMGPLLEQLSQLFPQCSPCLSQCPSCQQSWHWEFPKLSSLHLSACKLWHGCKAHVSAQSGRFQPKILNFSQGQLRLCAIRAWHLQNSYKGGT